MRITVKLFATLHQYQPAAPRSGMALEVPQDASVADILPRLHIPDGAPLVAMVNEKVEHLDYVLHEGDVLSLFPPVAGG
jgi:molybdopterin converting factor small subunit